MLIRSSGPSRRASITRPVARAIRSGWSRAVASAMEAPVLSDAIDREQSALTGRGRVLVRASGTEPLIRVMLAQALLGTNDPKLVDEAITNLRTALAREDSSAMGYRQLAAAYARKADLSQAEGAKKQFLAQAELASAEAYFYEGQLRLAKQQAKRAKAGFVDGTPNWIKADDILAFEVPN